MEVDKGNAFDCCRSRNGDFICSVQWSLAKLQQLPKSDRATVKVRTSAIATSGFTPRDEVMAALNTVTHTD